MLNLWANYDKYETLNEVAVALNKPESTVEKWVYYSRNISEKVKQSVARNQLTNEHVAKLSKYSHSIQNKLADVIIRKGISSDKNVLRPFLKSFYADPSADLDELADKALGIETVTVPVDKIPKEVLDQIDQINKEKEQLAKIQKRKK